MAYGNIYWAGFHSKNVEGILYIDQLDYVGTSSKLTLIDEGVSINYRFTDWEDPIVPVQCEFSIVNEKTNFFELLPLMTAEEREYKVRVVITSPSSYVAFEGYLNCEPASQKYLKRQVIDLVASNYLMKLEDSHPVSIDTLQNKTCIDIINEILVSVGSIFPVRVNIKIHAEGDIPTAGQTPFNLNGFFTELFWQDNVERTSSLEILTKILKAFNCYIYWWQSYWYIDRYEDMWSESIDYVEYDAETAYAPTDAGTVVPLTFTIEELNSNVFQEQSQTLGGIAGVKTVKITLNDSRFLNLVNGDFADATLISVEYPIPTYRKCELWIGGMTNKSWSNIGLPKNDIIFSVQRTLNTPAIDYNYMEGLFYSFKTTIKSKEDQLNCSFKYCLDPTTMDSNGKKLKDCKFIFHWYLRLLPDYDFVGQSNDVWGVQYGEFESNWIQSVEVLGSEFDEDTNSVSVNFSVPLGRTGDFRIAMDKGYLRGDQSFVLCIGIESFQIEEEVLLSGGDVELAFVNRKQPLTAWYGDVEVTTNGKDQDNSIKGTTNTKYLNKLDIDLDLYDADSYDYKNAILRGETLDKRTERWGTTGGATEIVSRGVCWSDTNNPPTLADSFSEDGTGYGEFESQITDLSPNTLYYYRAYATDALGTTEYGDTKSFTSEQLAVGHKYQGGLIGYIFLPGDAGYVYGETHGIIVSINDIDTHVVWGRLSGGGPYTCGATGKEIGDGVTNTDAIEANTFQNDFVIRKIVDYENEGYTDWFLPSLKELLMIGVNQDILGFAEDWYWSSTEISGSWKKAYAVNMQQNPGYGDYWDKHNYMRSRACRNF